jgi:cell division protein FtsB
VRPLPLVLGALLLLLQVPLWFGQGGVLALKQLQREIGQLRGENQQLRDRNLALGAEVLDLKQGLEAVEERARAELGMVRRGETFYHLVENRPAP